MSHVSWPCGVHCNVCVAMLLSLLLSTRAKAGSIFVVLAGQTPAAALHLHYTKGYLRLGRG